MMNKFILFISVFMIFSTSAFSQAQESLQARKYIRRGNKLFHAGKRKDAQIIYMKAIDADKNMARAKYNMATSMFPVEWKSTPKELADSMVGIFQKAIEAERNPKRKSMGYHNIGVIYQGQKNFQKAIDFYKNALRNNPNDDETRYNLVLCQRQLKNQPQQNQDNNKNNEQQDKQKQDQQKQDQQKQSEQNKQQKQEPPMSKENAEQLLKAAMQQEKKTQERLKDAQQQPQRRRIEKNW